MTSILPKDERFGLVSQIRRCSVSIPSNIAEGSGRTTNKDFANFVSIAIASAFELETQVILCSDLRFIEEEQMITLNNQVIEVQKMLYSFRKKLRGK